MLRILLPILAILGAVACGVLAAMSVPGQGEALTANWCAPTAKVDCGHVLASPYAKVGPVAAAQLGLAYFAFLAAWFGVVGVPNRAGRAWHLVPLGVIGLGLLFSAWFVYVMAVRLPVWCPWCVATHVVNALLFLATLAAWPRAARAAQPIGGAAAQLSIPAYPSMTRAAAVLGSATGLAILMIVALYAFYWQTAARTYQLTYLEATNNADYIEWRWRSSPKVEIPIRPDDPALGPADAAHVAVVFSDFECSHCAALHHDAAQLVRGFPGKLRFVFKHFPMNSACNPQSRTLHHYACDAAEAAEAARTLDAAKAEDYRAALYSAADRLAERPYRQIATRVGLDVAAFEKALAGRESAARISEDVELGRRLGITGSGQMFLDGRRLENYRIVTRDPKSQRDAAGTRGLWERLLGEKIVLPTTRPTSAPEAK